MLLHSQVVSLRSLGRIISLTQALSTEYCGLVSAALHNGSEVQKRPMIQVSRSQGLGVACPVSVVQKNCDSSTTYRKTNFSTY